MSLDDVSGLSVLSSPKPFGIDFCRETEASLAKVLVTRPVPAGQGARLVFTANLAHIVELDANAGFRDAYRKAWCVTADGTPVFLYALWRGVELPGRLAGSGLVAKMLPQLVPGRHRPFFIAPSEDAAVLCRAFLIDELRFDPDAVDFVVPPMGFEKDANFCNHLSNTVREHGTTHLMMGVGAPKSEMWAASHRDKLGDCYVLCVGAGLEFFVGLRTRGPEWMGALGLEWLCRVAQEPRRLFRRYFVSSWRYVWCVALDLSGKSILGSAEDEISGIR